MLGTDSVSPLPLRNGRSSAYLHVGTHKTGTTSVQHFLSANDRLLAAEAGIYVPRAGRADGSGGHHNIAWELNDDERFDPARGALRDVLAEIAGQPLRRTCLSSEDFEYLHTRPDALRRLAEGFTGIGFVPQVILYLRPQAGYAESLYAELVRHGLAISFPAFLDAIIATGEYRFNASWRFAFDYDRLVNAFADAFGTGNVTVRRYDARGGDVVCDFLPLIDAVGSRWERRMSGSRRLNAGLRHADVVRVLEQNTATPLPVGRGRAGRFDPVHLPEVRRIVERFNAGNQRVYASYGALVPCVSGRDLVADVVSAVGIDPASRSRRRRVQAIAHCLEPALERQTSGTASAVRPPPSRRRDEPLFAPQFVRPALLEGIIMLTAAVVAAASLASGVRTASTALVEFGMLSIIVAAVALALLVRCAVESRGVIADYPFFDRWGARLSVAGYGVIGLYAIVNALLDIGLGRYEPDWISYPGTITLAAAALILTAVQPLRRRILGEIGTSPMLAGVRDARFYLGCCYVALAAQVVHAVVTDWWLDTAIDVLVALFVGMKMYQIRRAVASAQIGVAA
jgi:hypothetical protein